ncbi:hypothetical protein O181_015893 [Austropuccinia psidii MF-1]|uniref:Uncharacterized protein n=1 Tax=Austropuccinia psidii MF-1 TaxID=1389203 RepID=A0A9Q3C3B3_9BASI|nr:hypothetical protein [Austropuccinia psidii MF-1]
MYEMTSEPLADHLPPLPCLLSCISWISHTPSSSPLDSNAYIFPSTPRHHISTITHPYASTPLLILSTTYHSYSPAVHFICASNPTNHTCASVPLTHPLHILGLLHSCSSL